MLSDIIKDKIRDEIMSYDIASELEEAVSNIDMSEFDDEIREAISIAVDDVDVEEMVGDAIESTVDDMF